MAKMEELDILSIMAAIIMANPGLSTDVKNAGYAIYVSKIIRAKLRENK